MFNFCHNIVKQCCLRYIQSVYIGRFNYCQFLFLILSSRALELKRLEGMYMKGNPANNFKLEMHKSDAVIRNINGSKSNHSDFSDPPNISELGKAIKVTKLSTGHAVFDLDLDLIMDKMQSLLDQLEVLNTHS